MKQLGKGDPTVNMKDIEGVGPVYQASPDSAPNRWKRQVWIRWPNSLMIIAADHGIRDQTLNDSMRQRGQIWKTRGNNQARPGHVAG